MEKIKVGIVGIANHGVTIRNSTLKCNKFQVVTCYDINQEEMNNFASSANCKTASSYEEIAKDPAIDAVILVTPNHQHLEQGVMALRNNKHIFLEKPITNNVKEGVELINEAKKQGKILQIGHNMRKRPHYIETKKLVAKGKIGDVVAFYANFSHDGGFNPKTPKWKTDENTCPLLPMMQLGIHFIDSIQFILGDVKKISAIGSSFAMGKGIIDSALANIELENGIIGNLQSHYVIPALFEFKIFGTKGFIWCRDSLFKMETIELGQKKVEERAIDEVKYSSYDIEMEDFADSIIENRQPEVTGLIGLKALAAIEAMNISLKEKRIVNIDEVFKLDMLK
jgi:predicted dehydrogenase